MPHRIIQHTINTRGRSEMIDVTAAVQEYIRQKQIADGYVIVFIPHTTAGVTIQENADPDVQHDVLRKLEQLIPQMESYYQHDEGNSDAHLKTTITGNSAMVLIENGRLVLGRWQAIYFMEFDGPRERRMLIKLIDERGSPA